MYVAQTGYMGYICILEWWILFLKRSVSQPVIHDGNMYTHETPTGIAFYEYT